MCVYLKYDEVGNYVIIVIDKVSILGCCVYVKFDKIFKVCLGFGMCVISISKGIMSGK